MLLTCYLLTQTVLLMKQNQKIFMKNFLSTRHLFDFSNYPKDSKFFNKTNNKVICKMKDVSEGKIIDEFIFYEKY